MSAMYTLYINAYDPLNGLMMGTRNSSLDKIGERYRLNRAIVVKLVLQVHSKLHRSVKRV